MHSRSHADAAFQLCAHARVVCLTTLSVGMSLLLVFTLLFISLVRAHAGPMGNWRAIVWHVTVCISSPFYLLSCQWTSASFRLTKPRCATARAYRLAISSTYLRTNCVQLAGLDLLLGTRAEQAEAAIARRACALQQARIPDHACVCIYPMHVLQSILCSCQRFANCQ